MNYIGSKLSLLPFLEQSISSIAKEKCTVFCDLFAGTGVVGAHFKTKGFRIIANDLQYYSFVLCKHYIENYVPLAFAKVVTELPDLFKIPIEKRAQKICSYLDTIPGTPGFIYNHYCLGGADNTQFHRQYFSDENGLKCDAIRTQIEQWKQKGYLTDGEYFFLLATLIENMDKLANTASVYGAFLKRLKASAGKPLIMKPAKLITDGNGHAVYNEDANQLIRQIQGDILYLDPPYNQRQYAPNYHLLETIARYDEPEINGKTGLRQYEKQKSDYCRKQAVKQAFADLIDQARFKYIFLSYNNEGLMTFDEIREIMAAKGKYGCFTQEYGRFRADKAENRQHKTSKTTEYLHYIICKN